MRGIVCAALWFVASGAPAAPLPALHATISETSISGVSSGGYMAVQFGVAHSAMVRGVGALAAGPYYCAEGSVALALTTCVSGEPAVQALVLLTRTWSAAGLIDPAAALARQRVWLFSGSRDTVVRASIVRALEIFYAAWLPKSAIRSVFDIPAAHGFVSDRNGSACDRGGSDYLLNCGFDAAGEILKQIYGELKPRAAQLSGRLIEFDQKEFAPTGRTTGLADAGYAYIPTECAAKKPCRVHVALHGCLQDAAHVGDAFTSKAGYNAWADSNAIIVLYPQIAASRLWPMNPQACWDWWGYTGPDYAQKSGPQIRAIYAMIARLAGGD